MKKSLFQTVKEIINNIYLESDNDKSIIFTRKELIDKLMSDKYKFYPIQHQYAAYDYIGKPIRCKDFNNYSLNTLDNIRNMLEKTGYLSKCYKPGTNQKEIILGKYFIQKLIPDDLTCSKLRKIYDEKY